MWGEKLHRALCAVSVWQIHSSAAPFLLPALWMCTAGIKAGFLSYLGHWPASHGSTSVGRAGSVWLSFSRPCLLNLLWVALHPSWAAGPAWLLVWRHSPRFPHGSRLPVGLPAHPQPSLKAGGALEIHSHLCCLGACPSCLCSCQVMPILLVLPILPILPAVSRPSRILHPAHTPQVSSVGIK